MSEEPEEEPEEATPLAPPEEGPPIPPEAAPAAGPPEDKGPPIHINLVLPRDSTPAEVGNAAIAAFAASAPPGELRPEPPGPPEPATWPPDWGYMPGLSPPWIEPPEEGEPEEVEALEGEEEPQYATWPLGTPGIRIHEPPPPLGPGPPAPPLDEPEGA